MQTFYALLTEHDILTITVIPDPLHLPTIIMLSCRSSSPPTGAICVLLKSKRLQIRLASFRTMFDK